jgi:hypothetical protein
MDITFGTLNVEEGATSIHIPKTCLAVLLMSFGFRIARSQPSPSYKREYTANPIVFNLKKIGNDSDDNNQKHYYELKRSELVQHGMELTTLYL